MLKSLLIIASLVTIPEQLSARVVANTLSNNEAHDLFVKLAKAQTCGIKQHKDFNEAQLTAMESYLRGRTLETFDDQKNAWMEETYKDPSFEHIDDHVCDVLLTDANTFYPDSVMSAKMSSTNRPAQQQSPDQQTSPNAQSEVQTANQLKALSEQVSVLMIEYAIAQKCADADVAFEKNDIQRMTSFMSKATEPLGDQEKDRLWGLTQSALQTQRLTENDCFGTLTTLRIQLPAVFTPEAKKAPF